MVFNRPFSNKLTVKLPSGCRIQSVTTLKGEPISIINASRQEYLIPIDKQPVSEPFVLRMQLQQGSNVPNAYRDALT